MSYYEDVYKKRVGLWGKTEKEQHLTLSKQYFDDYLLHSPNRTTIIVSGTKTPSIIIDNKDDENRITKYLLLPTDSTLDVAAVFEWEDYDWIILQKAIVSYQFYNKYTIVRATHTLKWVNSMGVNYSSPAFVRGSLESKITSGLTVSHNIIMPTPTKGLIAVLPKANILNNQRIIIENEAWKVSERDLVSTKGLMYVTLLEDKIDSSTDDLINSIADSTLSNSSVIDIGWSSANLLVGETITIVPKLYVKGIETSSEFIVTSSLPFVLVDGLTITGADVGSVTLKIACAASPQIFTTSTVVVNESIVENIVEYKIVGDETIKNGRSRRYTLMQYTNGIPLEFPCIFTLNSNLAEFISFESTHCIIKASEYNVGVVVLTASYESGIITKEIEITRLWG